ncbi:hypothetical protein ABH973_006720 [Bradyrhizobium ottawaense]
MSDFNGSRAAEPEAIAIGLTFRVEIFEPLFDDIVVKSA